MPPASSYIPPRWPPSRRVIPSRSSRKCTDTSVISKPSWPMSCSGHRIGRRLHSCWPGPTEQNASVDVAGCADFAQPQRVEGGSGRRGGAVHGVPDQPGNLIGGAIDLLDRRVDRETGNDVVDHRVDRTRGDRDVESFTQKAETFRGLVDPAEPVEHGVVDPGVAAKIERLAQALRRIQ